MEPFTAIADPVRRGIVDRLAAGEKSAGELGEGFGISQPAVSRHLRVLRRAGIVLARAESQRRVYRLNPAPLAEVDGWLARYRNLWEERMDSLREAVQRGASRALPRLVRYPGRVSFDLSGWDTGRWRSRPNGAPPAPLEETAA